MIEIEIQRTERVAVKFLKVDAGVRYWEDATVNGQQDESGDLIPCRSGDSWCPLIDLETGRIQDWPEGTIADLHYKVCDAGRYALLDADGRDVAAIDGYVPAPMCPGGQGYGDYIIMTIGPDGTIQNFDGTDLDDFSRVEAA